MPDTADLTFPVALAEVFAIGFEWDWDEDTDESTGCDFEPYEQFEAPDRTAWWFRLWTGNDEVDGGEFRFFGSTGAGDYAGCWLIRPDAPLTDQPIIYVGSEGETGVIATNLGDLLWIFANGSGPAEAFKKTDYRHRAERRFPRHRRAPCTGQVPPDSTDRGGCPR